MKTIIAGTRTINDIKILEETINNIDFNITKVVSGTAKGIDKLGEQWAHNNNISIERYPANWDRYGRSAGYIRNSEMANNAEALIAIWDGKSKGTKNMIQEAKRKGLKVHVRIITKRRL